VAEPEFNAPHLISEYQLGRFGWLMSLAFFCLGAASLVLFAAARQEVRTRPGLFGTWGLLIIGVAYFCAGIFPPDPKWFVGSLLHGLGGMDWSSSSARPWCSRR
jgi:CHASE2 domain-containing sensor protein